MARLIWSDRGVQFIDVGPPEEVVVAEVSFGRMKSAAKLIVRRRTGIRGRPSDVVEEELQIVKEKGKPAISKRVSKGAASEDRITFSQGHED